VKVELFCIAESASHDASGRMMTIRDVHNALEIPSFPTSIDDFALAARVRFAADELGTHRCRLEMRRPDGNLAGPPMEQDFEVVRENDYPYSWCSVIFEIPRMDLAHPEVSHFHLVIDGVQAATCVLITAQVLSPAPTVSRRRT
jgi:hypothetical protein